MRMDRLIVVAALLAALVGCRQEAERFGYKGADLAETGTDFFSTGPGVTNRVPARVLNVLEDYEFSADELRLIDAAGIVFPNVTLDEIPEGYAATTVEPWFTTFAKPCARFGLEGRCMFIAHCDDKGRWSTSESSFSSYWQTREEALAALGRLRSVLSDEYGAKRIYDFDGSLAAEYVRLRVLVVVGQKADGSWVCMLGIQDKCRPGCGNWQPVEVQQARLDRENYRKELIAWRTRLEGVLQTNHAIVEEQRLKQGIAGFAADEAAAGWVVADNGRLMCSATGTFEVPEAAAAANVQVAAWESLIDRVKSVSGVDLSAAEPQVGSGYGYEIRQAQGRNGLYEVVACLAVPVQAEGEEPREEGRTEVNPKVVPQWQITCLEVLQPGIETPVRPVLPQ